MFQVSLLPSIAPQGQKPMKVAVGLYSTAAQFLISSVPSSSRTYLIGGRIYPIGHD
jgi:hypothetical protein